MHYVYDFDSTLYSTQKIWDLWRGMLLGTGLSGEAVDSALRQALPLGYSPRKHADMLGIDPARTDDLVSRFETILSDEGPSLLFDDVAPFVEARRRDGLRQSILTMGDKAHQWEKMRTSGVDRLLPNIVISEPNGVKAEYLSNMLDEDPTPITFVDDDLHHLVPVHRSGLPIDLVRIKRPGETLVSAEPHELDNVAWRVITSLDELGG